MHMPTVLAQFTRQAEIIQAFASGLATGQATWKPEPTAWSILEVVNHLYDEEYLDFRVRIDFTLHHPGESWPAIDPAGWVTARRYNERDLGESLENFLAERRKSLAWLENLVALDWDRNEMAPWGAPIRAGDLLAAWLAHDLHHIRQLNELHYLWTAHASQPYTLQYAGDW